MSTDASGGPEAGEPRVPQQRSAYGSDGRPGVHADGGTGAAAPGDGAAVPADLPSGASAEFRVVAQRGAPEAESSDAPATVPNGITSAAANGVSTRGAAATSTLEAPAAPSGGTAADGGAQALLEVVGQLVERARAAGELRADVTVADVLLVIATGAPSLPDPAQQQAASARLLEILLEGLRSRPAG
ncbi:Helix-turn-helix transcriptional regulator OS=Streptomyces rimosus subsp. rimosus (strain ATCC/ DSM 40260 / JCM 4667 / NRRL 2234) OX=1265868 GN=SRIM_019530 PE=4 SV=1 [Streptomyces rimosus subsp. rimosus]